jgi:uncharacterized membrane protein
MFLVVMATKAFNGCVEVLGGVILLFYGQEVKREVLVLTNYEIIERHNDFVAKTLIGIFDNFSTSTLHFVSYYLLFHGLINLFLVISLWKRKLWAFPVSVVFFSFFVAYQFYRFYHNHSLNLLFITIRFNYNHSFVRRIQRLQIKE